MKRSVNFNSHRTLVENHWSRALRMDLGPAASLTLCKMDLGRRTDYYYYDFIIHLLLKTQGGSHHHNIDLWKATRTSTTNAANISVSKQV